MQIFRPDLVLRGIAVTAADAPLVDQAWLDRVHTTYYASVELTE